mgnify:CR=1 FL=1
MSEDIGFTSNEDEELAILAAIKNMGKEAKEEVSSAEPEKKVDSKKLEEHLAIYDALLTQKFFEENFKIGKRLGGVWRSRTTGQSNTIYKLVDASNFSSGLAINNYLNLLNMAYSLVVFNDENLRDKTVAERLKFFESLPEALVVSLSRSLVDFDAKIREAVEVGRTNF